MRFKEFKILKEATENSVVIIGDSIAVGMGGKEPYAKGGISSQEVLNRVKQFIQSGKAKGATVILSTGASNSAPVELEDGTKKPGSIGNLPEQQIKALIDAGAKVSVVGTGSEESNWFSSTKWTNSKKYRVDLSGVNEKLASAAKQHGAKFLGPLEEYDSGLHTGTGDGIHPYKGYGKLYQAGIAGASGSEVTLGPQNAVPQTPASKDRAATAPLKKGPPYPPEFKSAVTKLQKSLSNLGYSIGPTGLDGKYGPHTASAVAAFKKDYSIQGTGETFDADSLNILTKVEAGTIPKVSPTKVTAKPDTGINKSHSALLEPEFKPKLEKVASNLGISSDVLMKIMEFESKLNPKAVNPYSSATGLIQFMPSTARSLGTTTEELKNMSATEQLDYVEKYYKNAGVKPGATVGDLYILTFMPAAANKPDNFVLGNAQGGKVFNLNSATVYAQNKVFDKDGDGVFTKGDVIDTINQRSA